MVQETPQVTVEQIELWEADPVTIAYKESLSCLLADTKVLSEDGNLVDSGNAHLTHALIHRNLGQQDGLSDALNHEYMLTEYNFIKEVKDVA